MVGDLRIAEFFHGLKKLRFCPRATIHALLASHCFCFFRPTCQTWHFEPKNEGLVQVIFLFKQVIFRFHIDLRGCTDKLCKGSKVWPIVKVHLQGILNYPQAALFVRAHAARGAEVIIGGHCTMNRWCTVSDIANSGFLFLFLLKAYMKTQKWSSKRGRHYMSTLKLWFAWEHTWRHCVMLSVDGEEERELRKFKLMLLMTKIVLQLIGSLSSCSQGFQHRNWCRISGIDGSTLHRHFIYQGEEPSKNTSLVVRSNHTLLSLRMMT